MFKFNILPSKLFTNASVCEKFDIALIICFKQKVILCIVDIIFHLPNYIIDCFIIIL